MRTRHAVCAIIVLASLSLRAAIGQENESATVRTAAQKSLALLQASSRTWMERSGCASCHHQSLPAVAFALAKTRGLAVDDAIVREQVRVMLARWAPEREGLFQRDNGGINNAVFNAAYALLGLAVAEVMPNATTDAMVHFISTHQMADGRFRSNSQRPPLEYSDVTATALGIRALQQYAPPGRKDETLIVLARARNWLVSTLPRGTEEKTFQLLGLAWSGAGTDATARRASSLAAEQRPDGGWAQLPDLSSDAYATGQALVALHQAGGVPTSSAVYRKGVAFLLKTQLKDGSWLVTSRASGAQPYFESGFPHGTDQFISAAGTAWATSALLLSLEAVREPSSGRP
jgi:Prenyltransferase and squalene oxidase repeat